MSFFGSAQNDRRMSFFGSAQNDRRGTGNGCLKLVVGNWKKEVRRG